MAKPVHSEKQASVPIAANASPQITKQPDWTRFDQPIAKHTIYNKLLDMEQHTSVMQAQASTTPLGYVGNAEHNASEAGASMETDLLVNSIFSPEQIQKLKKIFDKEDDQAHDYWCGLMGIKLNEEEGKQAQKCF